MNKKSRFSWLIILIACTTILFISSCNKIHQVKFYVDDEIVDTIEIKHNQKTQPIEAPVKEYYDFVGWTYNGQIFDFNTKIKKDYDLYALYENNCQHEYSGDCDEECNICGLRRTPTASHNFKDATYTAPKTCQVCGKTEGDPIPQPKEVVTNVSECEIFIGETLTINAKVLPEVVSQEVEFSFVPDQGAEYTFENGVITGVHEGILYVTVSSKELSYISTTVKVTIVHPLIEEDTNEVFNIMTGFGTNASTDIEINFHTYNTKAYVEYTEATDLNFQNFTEVRPSSGYYFTEGVDIVESPFRPRNVMRVSISNLKANTEYIYRINKGDNTYSDIYHFKTANTDGGDSAFVLMSDIHYWYTDTDGVYTSHGSEISENIINKAIELNPNVGFIGTAGDIVDCGGSSIAWDMFFKESNSLKLMPRIGVAGNHEYYITGTGQSDGRYQKAHYANAYNGPTSQLGLSTYFIYNDILFIGIDNETYVGRSELLKWLEDVLENNNCRYSFVMMHTPVFNDNGDRDEKLLSIFDKYSVDLVISGHYHGEGSHYNYYNGLDSTDAGLGVNYLTLAFGGVKSRSETNLAKGYLFETHDGNIKITRITDDGSSTVMKEITSKRNQPYQTTDKKTLLDSVKINYDKTSQALTVSVSPNFYGNVKRMDIVDTLRNDINTYMVFPTSSYNKLVINQINPYYDYNFRITITFSDSSKEEILYDVKSDYMEVNFSDITNYSAILHFLTKDSTLDMFIKEFDIYLDGSLYQTVSYVEQWNPITSYQLNNLKPHKTYNVLLVMKDYSGNILYNINTTLTTN